MRALTTAPRVYLTRTQSGDLGTSMEGGTGSKHLHLDVYICIYLLSIYVQVCVFFYHLFFYPSIYLYRCLFICLSIHLFVYLYLSIYLFSETEKVQIPKEYSPYGFKYYLDAPTSSSVRREDDKVDNQSINQGIKKSIRRYELRALVKTVEIFYDLS